MKKQTIITIIILFILGAIIAFLLVKRHEDNEDRKVIESIDTQISKDLSKERSKEKQESSTTETSKESNSETGSSRTETTSEESEAIDTLLNEFGKKWVNYKTIYDRNQSVKDLLTKKAQDENGINADPHADFSGHGKMDTIAQSLDDHFHYVLMGEEIVNDLPTRTVLEVDLTKENGTFKIDKIVVSYVRQAY